MLEEAYLMQKEKFILCPVCGNKTRVQIREDTELKNFPLFCPKCHKQTLINAKQLNITKATEIAKINKSGKENRS